MATKTITIVNCTFQLHLKPIIAILIFGGVWGFWGVFFAIPLATVVNAVIRAWPRHGIGNTEDNLDQESAKA